MSNFAKKVSVPSAIKDNNRFDLSCKNFTTMDFFKLKPVYNRELVPHSSLKIDMGVFTRLSPLVKPAYAECNIINRAFWVPYRTILEGWNEFITDSLYKDQKVVVPYFSSDDLASAFFDGGSTTAADEDEFNTAFYSTDYLTILNTLDSRADFVVRGIGQDFNFVLTLFGKHCLDILRSLGYSFRNLHTDNDSSVPDSIYADGVNMSAMPLLAYYKLYVDWFRNPNYQFDWSIKFPIVHTRGALSVEALLNLLKDFRFAFYEKDLYTSAWDNPVAPNSFTSSDSVQIVDESLIHRVEAGKSKVTQDSTNGTPIITRGDGSTTVSYLSKYILQSLGLLTDYVKRHQLAGTQAMERFLARYGVVLSDAKLQRSVYCGKSVTPIEIADIMNQTAPLPDSDMPALGEYAGRGIGQGSGSFKVSSDEEFGQFIIVSVIIPKISYVQGRDRQLQHINRLDFWTPEFDGLGSQAIRCDELIGFSTGKNMPSDYNPINPDFDSDDVFGFSSRYYEDKTAQDKVTGDFILSTDDVTDDMNRYHLARLLPTYERPVHDLAFTRANPNQYLRIFADTNPDFDHFINIFFFNVSAQLPMKRMFDDYEFEDEDTGKRVKLPLGGMMKD